MDLLANLRYVVNAFNKNIFYNPKIVLKITEQNVVTEQFVFAVGIRTFYDISD